MCRSLLCSLLLLLCSQGLFSDDYTFIPDARNRAAGRDCKIALACVFQDEAPWLREWIEFHRLLGVEHFYLYNNLSSDNYLSTLEPYIESGVVELYDFPVRPFALEHQPAIYNHALDLARGHSDWLAIIDVDEFIVPEVADDLFGYLNAFPEDVGGVGISWHCYGTSNLWSILPGELMTEKLMLKAPIGDGRNYWFKSIVRPLAVQASINPHACSYLDGFREVRLRARDIRDIPLHEKLTNAIRINHYILRTKEFFYRVKVPRLNRWGLNCLKISTPDEYMVTMNQVEDRAIQKYLPLLKATLFPDSYLDTSTQHLGDADEIEKQYERAYASSTDRAEPLYYLAAHYSDKNQFDQAARVLFVALMIPLPENVPDVESWIYEYGCLFEYSKNACLAGYYKEALEACDKLLSLNSLPDSYRKETLKNRALALAATT